MEKKEMGQLLIVFAAIALVLLAILVWWMLHDPNTVIKEGGDVIIELG